MKRKLELKLLVNIQRVGNLLLFQNIERLEMLKMQ